MSTVACSLTPEEFNILQVGEQPIAGQILARIRAERGVQQSDLAKKFHVTRSAVAKWETGERWPKASTLDQLLMYLAPSTSFAENKRTETRVTQREMSALLFELEQAGKSEVYKAEALCTYAYPRVLSTLILRATGAPGINVDSRAIALFFDHRDKVREEKRRSESANVRDVTPEQAAWVDGKGVYKSETPQDVVKPSESGEDQPDGEAK